MKIQHILRTGLAILAITLAASGLAFQPSTAEAFEVGCCRLTRDIGVKFVAAAFRPEANGNGEDVAFEIDNVGPHDVPYPDISLTAYCNYKEWSTNVFTGSDKQPVKAMGIVKGSPGVPFLVTCPAKYHQSVSSVTLQSKTMGDVNSANDMAYWDRVTGGHSAY